METGRGVEAAKFSLTRAEHAFWGVSYGSSKLQLRATGGRRAIAVLLVASGGLVVAAGASSATGVQRVVVIAVGVLLSLRGGLLWFGKIVATRKGIVVWWLGVRRIGWQQVDYLEVVDRRPWWGELRRWDDVIDAEVVEVALRSGARVTLWPTRSSGPDALGTDEPSAAMISQRLLQRYREAYAPPV